MPVPQPHVLRLPTPPFAHNNIAFSPFFDTHLALASGANFGLVGNGRVHIVKLGAEFPGGVGVVRAFDTQDCVYDVAWNEGHENQVVAACGNGAIKMFDITLEGLPVQAWHEHSAEIMSIDWNNLQKDLFVTGSWDQTVKIWAPSRQTSLQTIHAHSSQIYSALFSPHSPSLLATCGSDGFLNIFDTRSPSPSTPVHAMGRGDTELLSCDWNKYAPTTLATAGKDGAVCVWDLRNPGKAIEVGRHGLAGRKVAWSPHRGDMLASAGYDMTCRVWTTNPPQPGPCHSEHTEFVMGASWALFDPGLLASAAWDGELHLYRV
ncbi:hypothetical protein IAT38_005015 [Cryptococcus sp. DSM 104549]